MGLYDLVVLTVAAVFGVAGARMAWKRLGDAIRVATASTPNAGTAAGAVVRVEGAVQSMQGGFESGAETAVPGEGTVTAPVSGRKCVGYVVSQQQHFATRIPVPRWRSVHAAGTVEAFALSATAHSRTVLLYIARTAAYALFAAGALAVTAATLPTAL